jgi:hypothetical protein
LPVSIEPEKVACTQQHSQAFCLALDRPVWETLVLALTLVQVLPEDPLEGQQVLQSSGRYGILKPDSTELHFIW